MTKRLTRDDWVAFGLLTLAKDGPNALRADRLCKARGVSRGSFYWHFADLAAFHAALVTAWTTQTTDIMQQIETQDVEIRLSALMQAAGADGLALEAAMRSWAGTTPDIALAVAKIDQIRVDFVTQIFSDLGHDTETATARARFLYASNLGRIVSLLPDPDIAPDQLAEIARLLISHPENVN